MSKNRKRIITFLLLGTILLTGYQKNVKAAQLDENCIEFFDVDELSQDISVSSETIETIETIQPLTGLQKQEEIVVYDEPLIPYEYGQMSHIQDNNHMVVQAKNTVNLRTSNSTNALIIDQLQMYDKGYKILSCENGWDLIKFNDKIGYVFRDYIRYTNELYQSQYNHIKHDDIVITTSSLNFRSAPTTNADKITTFAKDTELQVLATIENSDWLLVRYNGVLGYVHGGYVVSMLDRANDLYPELCMKDLKVERIVYPTTGLNLRTGNNTTFPSINYLEKYETLRVLGTYNNWYFVMTNDYNFGFVSAVYTKILDNKYVIVDKSEQQLYLYNANELLYTTPVTTGKDSTPSDTGLFEIRYKTTNKTLTDNRTYWSPVRYWMPYNGGEGLHDADWRNVFGTESYHYNGSHGCINMPVDITDEIYNNVEAGTKVLVHK